MDGTEEWAGGVKKWMGDLAAASEAAETDRREIDVVMMGGATVEEARRLRDFVDDDGEEEEVEVDAQGENEKVGGGGAADGDDPKCDGPVGTLGMSAWVLGALAAELPPSSAAVVPIRVKAWGTSGPMLGMLLGGALQP